MNHSKSSFSQKLARWILRLIGWQAIGQPPDLAKYLIVNAPHTSNWDFLLMVLYRPLFQLDAHWIGKHTVFKWPFGRLMRWLGGIPVDRRLSNNFVEQIVAAYRERDKLVVGIAPEGTRRHTLHWRTGFYYIAVGAQIPISLVFMDYGRKEAGFGPLLYPSGDIDSDFAQIRAFYADKKGKNPQWQGEIVMRPAEREDK